MGRSAIEGLVIRRAIEADTDGMRELTRDTWNGTDYVPLVWNRWLADAAGYPMTAVLDGKVVAIQHLEMMPDGSAWLEGIRVAPGMQGNGIGTRLIEEAVGWARSAACPAVRLATASTNPASNRVAEGAGFHRAGELAVLEAAPGATPSDAMSVRVAATSEAEAIERYLRSALGPDRTRWLYTEGWTAYLLTPSRLRLLLATQAIAVVGVEGISALAIGTCMPERPVLRLGLLLGPEAATEALARWMRACAKESGLSGVRANMATTVETAKALAAAGFRPRFEFDMVIHELRLD